MHTNTPSVEQFEHHATLRICKVYSVYFFYAPPYAIEYLLYSTQCQVLNYLPPHKEKHRHYRDNTKRRPRH